MINGKKVLAFIPAKTGSVGLPGKLFKKIGYYTLLEWTLFAAYQSNYIDEVIVSSNDLEIKKITEDFEKGHGNKAKISFVKRHDAYCTPTSKTEEAIAGLFGLGPPLGYTYDYLIVLQGTSPARRNGLIDKCIEAIDTSKSDSLITVEKSTPFFWRKNKEVDSSYPIYSLKDRPMRQELKEEDFYFKDNGNIYITKVQSFLQTSLRVSGKTYLYETEAFENMQIDDPDDFAIVSKMFEHYGSFL